MTETELLFTEILGCDRLSLYLKKDLLLDKDKSFFISTVLKRRARGEPIQYILGKTEFMGLEFKVGQEVFIPRPETEVLVETAVKQLFALRRAQDTSPKDTERSRGVSFQPPDINILDLGTGSGCIAISLAKFVPGIKIAAVDISDAALETAGANAKLNGVENSISFLKGDLLTACDLRLTTYDLIISNPPYVPAGVIEMLQPEVKSEPRAALDGGPDGLDFYRRIIMGAAAYLKTGGLLLMEMGPAQGEAIKEIFELSGKFEIIETVKDYNNMDRVVVARNYG